MRTTYLHKSIVLTTFSWSECQNYISLDVNDLTLIRDGQNTLAKSGQGQWLLHCTQSAKLTSNCNLKT